MARPDPVLDQTSKSHQAGSNQNWTNQALSNQALSNQLLGIQASRKPASTNPAWNNPAVLQRVPTKPGSRTQVRSTRALAVAALMLALTACGGEGDGAASGGAPAPVGGADAAAVAPPAAVPKSPAPLVTPAGLTPLPSPQQVVGPVSSGRADPFAPLPALQAGPKTPNLPAGFRFTGVIQTRGLAQAIVQLGDSGAAAPAAGSGGQTSATLCIGPRGQCPGAGQDDYRLPPGWSVTGIDVRHGVLSLRQGGLPLRLPLGSGAVGANAAEAPDPALLDFMRMLIQASLAANNSAQNASPPGPSPSSLSPSIPSPGVKPSPNAGLPGTSR